MATENLKISSAAKESDDRTLVQEDYLKVNERETVLVKASTPVKTEEIKTEENKNKESIPKIQVKYVLNKVKNLETAKINAARPVRIERFTTNDTNTRYEMNSGQYLYVKEEMKNYKKGETETTENGEYSFKVEKNSVVDDKNKNNPETQIKLLITNNKTQETSNFVVKLYHTNQSIHLQGGRRMGKVTSTSLMADHLEGHWKRNLKDNMNTIKDANEQLKAMVIKSRMATRARTGSGEPILNCDMCSYSCA